MSDVIVFVAPDPWLSVGEEFRRARVARRVQQNAETHQAALEQLAVELEEPEEEAERDRPCGKFCVLCARLPHRVTGPRCEECGTERRESA